MMKNEFEALTGFAIQLEDYQNTVEYIYMNSAEYKEKQQVADFFLNEGLHAMEEYAAYMRSTEALWKGPDHDGEFPGKAEMEAIIRKALAPDLKEETVDIYDWEFRTFLRNISRLCTGLSRETLANLTRQSKKLFLDKSIVALTKTLAEKQMDETDNRCWAMQSYLSDAIEIPEIPDYGNLFLTVLREMEYEI